MAGFGLARRGRFRQGLMISALGALPPLLGSLNPVLAWRAQVRCGELRTGLVDFA